MPVALGRDVPKGSTRAIILEGAEYVAWRGSSGTVQIWEDRCPHRGMRLSFGFVRGETLKCLYHGWTYRTDAACTHIPAHPDLTVPPTIRAKAFASAETGGMIWLDRAGDAGPPPLFLLGRPIASLAIATTPEILLGLLDAKPDADAQAVSTHLDGSAVTLGWHVVSPEKLMLHAVATDPGDIETRVLLRLHALRAAAETRAAA